MRSWVPGTATLRLLIVCVGSCALHACSKPNAGAKPPSEAVLRLADGPQTQVARCNMNPLQAGPPWPVMGSIFEPLLVFNRADGEFVPWLAQGYRWSEDVRTLTFALRRGVRWSDGTPFGAKDVAFTVSLLKRHPGLDHNGLWEFLGRVDAVDERTVRFEFIRPYSPALSLFALQAMLPEHRYGALVDPASFVDDHPVGTGPFTQLRTCDPGGTELGRNPRYWQEGKPAFGGVRSVHIPSNEGIGRALAEGELDWATAYFPDAQRTFVARDTEHHHIWRPPWQPTVLLYANLSLPQFQNVELRKAMSQAIDRRRLVREALGGAASVADATALPEFLSHWRDDAALRGDDWTAYDPAKARARLEAAGYRPGADGILRSAKSVPLHFHLDVIEEWTDWHQAALLVAQDLRGVGMDVEVRATALDEFRRRLFQGEYETSIAWGVTAPTPYHVYQRLMGSNGPVPIGTPMFWNFQRFHHADVDRLLRDMEKTAEAKSSFDAGTALQRLFIREAPAIPLFSNPVWASWSTKRFRGFPDARNPYARPAPQGDTPEVLLVLMKLEPTAP
jgi:peptide/nickel transport system substrate-binding protein